MDGVNVELVVALVSAVISLGAGVFSARANRRARELDFELERRKKAEDAAEIAQRILHQYRDPLLDAAQTLQSRSYNIVANGYLGRFLHCGDPDEERYARDYTVFALAEYLTWVEILRREVRFLDVGDEVQNKKLMELLMQTQLTIQSDKLAGPFRIFRGHQRAIAELMMVPTGAPDGPRHECLGYATFCDRLDEDEGFAQLAERTSGADSARRGTSRGEFARWFTRLRAQVDDLVPRDNDERLVQLQNDLVDLIDHLDPKALRIPPHFRARLPKAAGPTTQLPAQAGRRL